MIPKLRPVWDELSLWFEPSNNPNYDSIALLLSFHQLFQEIRIVTTRFCRIEIVDFVEKYQLPISAIHCTIRRTKRRNFILHWFKPPVEMIHKNEAAHNQNWKIPTILVSYRFDRAEEEEICSFDEC